MQPADRFLNEFSSEEEKQDLNDWKHIFFRKSIEIGMQRFYVRKFNDLKNQKLKRSEIQERELRQFIRNIAWKINVSKSKRQ